MTAKITLLTGGARSGKSHLALQLAQGYRNPAFIATATAFDLEMRSRIKQHQQERQGQFFTVEEPLELAEAIQNIPPETGCVVVDCLTLWLNNLIFECGEQERYPQIDRFLTLLKAPPCPLFLVTNELGMGLVPEQPLSRFFRDQAGRLNQEVATRADRVLFLVCGLPLTIKPVSLAPQTET